jgi:hypothetical protein
MPILHRTVEIITVNKYEMEYAITYAFANETKLLYGASKDLYAMRT